MDKNLRLIFGPPCMNYICADGMC